MGFEARVVFWYCLPPNPLSTMHSSIREFFFRYPRLEPAWITPAPQCLDTITWVPDNSDRDKSARKRGLVGPYIKTTRTINNCCCLTYFFNKIDGNHKDTVWHLSIVLRNVKKNPYIINQNHIFFKKLLWSHFWIDFYKCYTKTFGIVYILIGY